MQVSTNVSSILDHQSMLNKSAQKLSSISQKGSNTDLAKEITNQIIAKDGVSVNANAIKTQNEMMGSLLDLKA